MDTGNIEDYRCPICKDHITARLSKDPTMYDWVNADIEELINDECFFSIKDDKEDSDEYGIYYILLKIRD
jgi:hypothetical protein